MRQLRNGCKAARTHGTTVPLTSHIMSADLPCSPQRFASNLKDLQDLQDLLANKTRALGTSLPPINMGEIGQGESAEGRARTSRDPSALVKGTGGIAAVGRVLSGSGTAIAWPKKVPSSFRGVTRADHNKGCQYYARVLTRPAWC